VKRYLFFLRHFNDTDNIEPVIYFLLKKEKDASITVFYYSLDFDFRRNRNLAFLQSEFGERFKVDWIGWHLKVNPDLQFRPDFVGRFYQLYNKRAPWRRSLDGILGQSRYRFPEKTLDGIVAKVLAEHGHPSLVVFDQNRTHQIAGLLRSLRKHGVWRIVSLPVSPFVNINVMRSTRFGSLDPAFFKHNHDYSGFDVVCVSDRHYLENLARTFKLLGDVSPLQEVGVPVGSIRFCPEWMAIRETRVATYEGKRPQAKRKLLFLLSQPASNSNWHAVRSCLKMLAHFPEYDIVIKPHTRRFEAELGPLAPNMTVEPDVDSSSLLNWTDVVLFWGTSMALEGYLKSKTMLCADFLNTNEIVFTKYNAGRILRSLDDLHEALVRYVEEGQASGYRQEDVDTMLFNVVQDGREGAVPQRYLDFIDEQEQLSART
jgi:hypothetical protein